MADPKHLCTFYVGDGYFGIPVEQVQEIVRPLAHHSGAAGAEESFEG